MPPDTSELDALYMLRALELARRGQGWVEPNPMVGCAIVSGGEVVGEGWHRRFGGPHAEIEALKVAGARARGATLYATLEPCCHHGKTPPCVDAILAAGVGRVVAACEDPFPAVAGQGIERLRAAGVSVDVGICREPAERINAPYLKLLRSGRPWMIAKWAMSLDGKLATRTGDSRWITGPEARAVAHQLRGRVDAILIGIGTALTDDPLLTARPPGPRTATRIVLDSSCRLAADSQLARTLDQVPLLVIAGAQSSAADRRRLTDLGCEVLVCDAPSRADQLRRLLDELGRRRMTNVLVEGGSQVLGAARDAGEIDEVHVFIAPRLIGGAGAPAAIAGQGPASLTEALSLAEVSFRQVGNDLYLQGLVQQERPPPALSAG